MVSTGETLFEIAGNTVFGTDDVDTKLVGIESTSELIDALVVRMEGVGDKSVSSRKDDSSLIIGDPVIRVEIIGALMDG